MAAHMTEREVSVAVFQHPLMKGVWIKPDDPQRHLAEELEEYE